MFNFNFTTLSHLNYGICDPFIAQKIFENYYLNYFTKLGVL